MSRRHRQFTEEPPKPIAELSSLKQTRKHRCYVCAVGNQRMPIRAVRFRPNVRSFGRADHVFQSCFRARDWKAIDLNSDPPLARGITGGLLLDLSSLQALPVRRAEPFVPGPAAVNDPRQRLPLNHFGHPLVFARFLESVVEISHRQVGRTPDDTGRSWALISRDPGLSQRTGDIPLNYRKA